MMMFRYKKAAAVLLAAAIGAAALSGCGKKEAVDGTQTAMTVNGETVSLGTVSFEAHYDAAVIYSYYGSYLGNNGYFDTEAGDESGNTIGQSMVLSAAESIRDEVILSQHAAEYGAELTEEQKKAIDETAQAFMDKNDADLLKKFGVTKEDVVRSMTLDTIRSNMLNPMAADVSTEVSDEEAHQSTVTYVGMVAATEEEDGKSPEELNEETKATLQEILDKIKAEDNPAEADIDAIAKSVDETYNGTQVYFSPNDEDPITVDKVIADAVKGLKDGEVYDGILTNADGSRYFIVRLDKEFDETATENRKGTIVTDRKQARFNELFDQWKEEADATINNDVLAQISISDAELYTFKVSDGE